MKSTDLMRKDRDLKKQEKKNQLRENRLSARHGSVGQYIQQLHDLFYFDTNQIYNIDQSDEIFELLEDLKDEHPEKQWFNVISKAVRKTKVIQKEDAITLLCELADISVTK